MSRPVGTYVLSVEEIKALHANPPNLPPGALGHSGPCRCPVCDPEFHARPARTPMRELPS